MLVYTISLVLPLQNTRKVEVCLKTVPTVNVRPQHYQLLQKHTPPTKPSCVLRQSLQVATNNKHREFSLVNTMKSIFCLSRYNLERGEMTDFTDINFIEYTNNRCIIGERNSL